MSSPGARNPAHTSTSTGLQVSRDRAFLAIKINGCENVQRVAFFGPLSLGQMLDNGKLRIPREHVMVISEAGGRGRAWLALDVPGVSRGPERGAVGITHMDMDGHITFANLPPELAPSTDSAALRVGES